MKREDFFGEYCLQLRRECETIRSEMNRFLYFALVILGAIGFVITKGREGREFVQQPVSIAVATVALIAITSLFCSGDFTSNSSPIAGISSSIWPHASSRAIKSN